MAHCIAVTENAIRIQLPGGKIYAPAFDQAAAKTGARSGLASKHNTALKQLVSASVAALNSGEPTMITLEMVVHEDSITVTVAGKGCGSVTKKLLTKLQGVADKKASTFSTKKTSSTFTISFAT